MQRTIKIAGSKWVQQSPQPTLQNRNHELQALRIFLGIGE
jgi:hypothetical protein